MKKLLLILFLKPCLLFSQTIKEKLIYANTDSSLLMGSYSFDKEGNYCFEAEKEPKKHYAITKEKTIGPFKYTSSSFSNSGRLSKLYNSSERQGEFFYKNGNGIKYLGPVTGEIDRQLTNSTRQRIALTVFNKDSIYYYLDDQLVAKQFKSKNLYSTNDDWCVFSQNGRAIYYLPKDSFYILYIDGKPVDTSEHRFYQLGILDNSNYVFAKGDRPKQKSKYDFMFFIHTKDTTIGPVRTVWKYYLNEDGSYYYTGDDNGPDYIIINNALYKDIDSIDNILTPDRSNYMFSFVEAGQHKMNVNGHIYTYDCPSIILPNMDTVGNFAWFGLKDYYLYKYVNGRRLEEPLSRYGVRAMPLYISATGNTVHFFKTDDSIYLYRDDQLLLPPIVNHGNFSVRDWQNMICNHPPREKPGGKNQLAYFEFDSTGYFLFNGTLSKSMALVKPNAVRNTEVGRIVLGDMNDNGFFVIQKTGEKAYTININNTAYATVDGIDKISWDDYFFDGKELVFYAIKGLSFYQYTIKP